MSPAGKGELLALIGARPIRDHIDCVRVLEDYHGPIAYFNRGLVMSPEMWERITEVATVVQGEGGLGSRVIGLPVHFVNRGSYEHYGTMVCWASGLFSKVTNDGSVIT